MALCEGCKDNKHQTHTSTVYLQWKRKGLHADQMSRKVACNCSECTQPEGWRGTPQPLPMTFGHRWR